MSSLEISVRAEAEARVLGIHWRPLRQAKVELSELLSGLTNWADSVIAFFINLPLIMVWLVSGIALLAVALRVFRLFWQRLVSKTTWRFRGCDRVLREKHRLIRRTSIGAISSQGPTVGRLYSPANLPGRVRRQWNRSCKQKLRTPPDSPRTRSLWSRRWRLPLKFLS
jgi:hypothetical protein